MVGSNVQTVVDAERHLIVAHDVIMTASDRQQLSSMAGDGALTVDDALLPAPSGPPTWPWWSSCVSTGLQGFSIAVDTARTMKTHSKSVGLINASHVEMDHAPSRARWKRDRLSSDHRVF